MYACFNWTKTPVGQYAGGEYSFAALVRPGLFTVGAESPNHKAQLELSDPEFRRLFSAMFAQMEAIDSVFVDAVIRLNRKETP